MEGQSPGTAAQGGAGLCLSGDIPTPWTRSCVPAAGDPAWAALAALTGPFQLQPFCNSVVEDSQKEQRGFLGSCRHPVLAQEHWDKTSDSWAWANPAVQ